MEFGLREVLIALGLLVIAGILVDGVRRTRLAKDRSISSPPMGKNAISTVDEELVSPARPVRRDPTFGSQSTNETTASDTVSNLSTETIKNTPTDTLAVKGSAIKEPAKPSIEDDESLQFETESHKDFEKRYAETQRTVSEPDPFEDPAKNASDEVQEDLFDDQTSTMAITPDDELAGIEEFDGGDSELVNAAANMPSEVIIINVIARDENDLPTDEFYQTMSSCGFHHGDMDIFHRYEQHNGGGRLLFSAANVVEPGTFPAQPQEGFGTPGVCLFLQLPGPARPLQAFDAMVDASRKISKLLGADIKDEQHCIMTQQTFEHCRQRVIDFERKQLSAKSTVR